jgi:hypothetical protein
MTKNRLEYFKKCKAFAESYLGRKFSNDSFYYGIFQQWFFDEPKDRPLSDYLMEHYRPYQYQREKEKVCKDFGLIG